MDNLRPGKAGLKLVKLLLREAFVLEAMGIMPSKDAVLAVLTMRKGDMQNCPNTAISINKLGLFEDIGKQLRDYLANTETSIHLPYLGRGEACLELMAKATFHCFSELWVECQRLHGQESLASSKQLLGQYTHPQHHSGLWPVMFAACSVKLWRSRNDRVFNRIQTPIALIKARIWDNLRLWTCRSRKDSEKTTLLAWVNKFTVE